MTVTPLTSLPLNVPSNSARCLSMPWMVVEVLIGLSLSPKVIVPLPFQVAVPALASFSSPPSAAMALSRTAAASLSSPRAWRPGTERRAAASVAPRSRFMGSSRWGWMESEGRLARIRPTG